jgi:hypothetical protein
MAVGVVALGLMFQPLPELTPECLKASRCCLAEAHQTIPTSPDAVSRCVTMASSEDCRVPADAERCRAWSAEGARAWEWPADADELPTSDQREPQTRIYPRVTCKQAVERLIKAIESGEDGPALAIRPRTMFIKSLTQRDPDGFLYCEGFPIPIQGTPMWSRELMREPAGPHTLLAKPRAAGHYQLAATCRRCNCLGKECPNPRR